MSDKLTTKSFFPKEENADIQIFNNSEFGEIRTVTIDNEPWFVAKDIS